MKCDKVPISSIPSPQELFNSIEGPSFLLESREGPSEKARISVVGWEPEVEEKVWKDVDRALRELSKGRPVERDLLYRGGPVGYVSYEAVEDWEDVRHKGLNDMGWPKAQFMVPRKFVVYNHVVGTAFLCNVSPSALSKAEVGRLEVWNKKLDVEKAEFLKWVEEARRKEEEGEAIQVVLSKSYTMNYEGDLRALYMELAKVNPSPYMFHLRFEDAEVIGSSPELLYRVEGNKIETFPIAGTRPRGRDPWEDVKLEEELLSDEKERAEHIMLVDLARNDIGKVSLPGSVKVSRYMFIEKYSHVQHLVSKVEGELDPNFDAIDVLKATFPAGTVSGAPKPSAMEIIGNLEKLRRGPYAGAVGFVDYSGNAEFAITIRSYFARNGRLRIQAGAGIVYYSIPEREWEETEHKLRALNKALEKFSRQ
ncbi:anthranilate synthase subunit I [Ignicoccus islandicus DSM 13165]|uniref:anthranilate synthase n=1 Tax=Ignicoccus islandicus DSM 13165 TaxID=940295 RepID=A0A0U3FQW7_9CREN|nr:chorismate-binding protein [Ignicoccus islandicus]ALU11856.1 anthranilate synthase subunit I [Ignicoccus islandicus DSM 13165]